jgi:hypothetical protein
MAWAGFQGGAIDQTSIDANLGSGGGDGYFGSGDGGGGFGFDPFAGGYPSDAPTFGYTPSVDWSGGSLSDYFGGSGGFGDGVDVGSTGMGGFGDLGLPGLENGGGWGSQDGYQFNPEGWDSNSGFFNEFNKFAKSPFGKIALGLLGMANPALGIAGGLASAIGSSNPGAGIGSVLGSVAGGATGIPMGSAIGSMAGAAIGGGQSPSNAQLGSFAGSLAGGLTGNPLASFIGSQVGGYAGSQFASPQSSGNMSVAGVPSGAGGPISGIDAGVLGLGTLYGNMSANKELSGVGRQLNQAQTQNNGLTNLYGPNSPYAQQLRQQLERRDAAAGRRSQYGPREVELQAKLAQVAAQQQNNQARNNIDLGKVRAMLGQQKMNHTNSNLAQLTALYKLLGGSQGLASMFGGGGSLPAPTSGDFGAESLDPFGAFQDNTNYFDPQFGG